MFPCPRVKGQKFVTRTIPFWHSFGWHVDDVTKAPPEHRFGDIQHLSNRNTGIPISRYPLVNIEKAT